MSELQIPPPTDLKHHRRSRELTVRFADGMNARLSAEFLRVHSPSAEVKGHSAGEGMLVTGKEAVRIANIEPVGRYAELVEHGPRVEARVVAVVEHEAHCVAGKPRHPEPKWAE